MLACKREYAYCVLLSEQPLVLAWTCILYLLFHSYKIRIFNGRILHVVRFVIHHSLSKSMETYYQVCVIPLKFSSVTFFFFLSFSPVIKPFLQESGRAGRDGLPSECVLYFRPGDVPRQVKICSSLLSCIFLHDISFSTIAEACTK